MSYEVALHCIMVKGEDILAFVGLILIFNQSLVSPQLNESAMLNCWSAPSRHNIIWKHIYSTIEEFLITMSCSAALSQFIQRLWLHRTIQSQCSGIYSHRTSTHCTAYTCTYIHVRVRTFAATDCFHDVDHQPGLNS